MLLHKLHMLNCSMVKVNMLSLNYTNPIVTTCSGHAAPDNALL